MSTVAYRWCIRYTRLVGLNIMWIATSLLIVTAPAATAVLIHRCRSLSDDDFRLRPRQYLVATVRATCSSWLVIALAAPAWLLCGAVLISGVHALLTGMATVAVVALIPVTVVALVAPDYGRTGARALRYAAIVVLLRPGRSLVIACAWVISAALCVALPSTVALPVWAVAVAGPAYVTARALTSPGFEAVSLFAVSRSARE